MVSDIVSKLEVGPAILGEQGKEGIKLCLSKTDNMCSSFFSELFEVELSSSAKCLLSGLGSRW